MPEKSIVANEDSKESSIQCRKWLPHSDNCNIQPEVTIWAEKSEHHVETSEKKPCFKFKKNRFVVDGYDKKTNNIYEYYG